MVEELAFFFEFQICQRKSRNSLSKEKYARNTMENFGMEKAKCNRAPASFHLKISKDGYVKRLMKVIPEYYGEFSLFNN